MPVVLPRELERYNLAAEIPFYATVEREEGLFCYLRFHQMDGKQFLSEGDLVVLDRTLGETTVFPSDPLMGQDIQPFYLLLKNHAYRATYLGKACFDYGDHYEHAYV